MTTFAPTRPPARFDFPGARTVSDPAPMCLIPGREHPAQDGLRICDRHLQELGRLLHDIEDEAAILSAAPSYSVNYESKGSKGLASEQAPARLNVIAFTDPRTNLVPATPRSDTTTARQAKRSGPWCLMCDHQTCRDWRAGRQRDLHDDEQDAGSDRIVSAEATLHSWADNVRDYRKLSVPEHTTLSGERDLLTRQLRYIAEQDWVRDFYTELKQLARELTTANGTADVPAGVCTDIDNGHECGGNVWHIMIKHSVGADEPGFRCSKCRRVWTGTEAVRKRDRMWRADQERKAGSAS